MNVRGEVVLLVMLFFIVYANLVRLVGNYTSAQAVVSATGVTSAATLPSPNAANPKHTLDSPSVPLPAEASSEQTTPVVIADASYHRSIAQQCTGSTHIRPAALAVHSLPEGLTTVVDAPTYYQVYGTTMDELRSAVENCPFRRSAGTFHGVTSYQLNWSYSPVSDGTTCTLRSIRVGMHVNQYLPLFIPSTTTPVTITATWSAYAAALKAHEDGHTAINRDYAQRLTTALQQASAVDCTSLAAQAETTLQSYTVMLNTANELYDSQTNHGATQGAVL